MTVAMGYETKTATAREAALSAYCSYRRNGADPGEKLAALVSDMPARDVALAKRVLTGMIQNTALIDYYIDCFSSIKPKKIEPLVLDILRLSVYQLVFMSRIPHNAAVDEGVKIASRNANPRAAGFVNAVLRGIAGAAERHEMPPVAGDGDESVLSVKYSHPQWIVREFCESFGADGAEALLRANNADDVPVTAQVNTLLTDADEAVRALEADGVTVRRHGWLDDCLDMSGTGDVTRLDAFKRGYIYIQDAAARLAAYAAGPEPGMFVIDGCAAPGGKSFASAIMMGNKGRIAAFDLTAEKLRRIDGGARRLKLGIIEAVHRDAGARNGDYRGGADIVIADVPCSGMGVIRKKPEIRYKSERSLDGLPEIQKRLLQSLSAYVKPGGVLLYSTCSLLTRENREVVDWFLENNSEFNKETFTMPHIGEIKDGCCTLLPHIHGTDGFFICRMRRGTGG